MKFLLIDSSSEIAGSLSLALKMRWPSAGFLCAITGAQGLEMLEKQCPDLVIGDVDLPDIDGFEVLKQIRLFSNVPVIILSKRDAEVDRVRGLESGADDYVTKPFSPLDFLARVHAVLRRAGAVDGEQDLPPFKAANLTLDFSSREFFSAGQRVHLTPTEYKLLCHLVRNEGRVVTSNSLKRVVWNDIDYLDPTTVKKYIYQLRIKLGDNADCPRMIMNERGIGYKFVKPRPSPVAAN